jgi:hypothetical protein
MAKLGDLTTIEHVKAWLNTSGKPDGTFPTGSDALLSRLVTSASKFIQSYLSRNIPPNDYTWVTNGFDTQELFLKNYPIIAVESVTIGNLAIPVGSSINSQPGFMFDDDRIYLNYYYFCRGLQNIQIVYSAGYQITGEAITPEGATVAVSTLDNTWNADRGISYANGTALVKVGANPAVGQYALTQNTSDAFQYQFNAADVGSAMLVNYGYTPDDLEQAIIELVGEAFKRRDHIGLVSKGLAEQPTTFSQKDMSDSIRTMLQPYKAVVPVI